MAKSTELATVFNDVLERLMAIGKDASGDSDIDYLLLIVRTPCLPLVFADLV